MFDIIDKTFGNIVLKLESLPILEYKNLYTYILYHFTAVFICLISLFFGQKLKEGFVLRQPTNGSSTQPLGVTMSHILPKKI